jgi:hypothetical protein
MRTTVRTSDQHSGDLAHMIIKLELPWAFVGLVARIMRQRRANVEREHVSILTPPFTSDTGQNPPGLHTVHTFSMVICHEQERRT